MQYDGPSERLLRFLSLGLGLACLGLGLGLELLSLESKPANLYIYVNPVCFLLLQCIVELILLIIIMYYNYCIEQGWKKTYSFLEKVFRFLKAFLGFFISVYK